MTEIAKSSYNSCAASTPSLEQGFLSRCFFKESSEDIAHVAEIGVIIRQSRGNFYSSSSRRFSARLSNFEIKLNFSFFNCKSLAYICAPNILSGNSSSFRVCCINMVSKLTLKSTYFWAVVLNSFGMKPPRTKPLENSDLKSPFSSLVSFWFEPRPSPSFSPCS